MSWRWFFLIYFLSLFETCFLSFPSSPQLCHLDERYALLQLWRKHYYSPYSKNCSLKSWNKPNTDCCHWEGITCNVNNGHVVALDLPFSSLNGSIHSNSTLFHLHHLQILNLSGNHFSGRIPSQISQLTDLISLDLSFNNFEGLIPSEISRLTKLVFLDLSIEKFSTNGNNLSTFGFSPLEIPDLREFVQKGLSSLRELHLNGVDLSSPKNRDWCHHLSSTLPNLHVLSMRDCSLTGPLDASISSLHFLSELYLGYNTNISSTTPISLANLTSLTFLGLGKCGLCGDFPSNVFLLPNLMHIELYGNPLLSGHLPEFPRVNSALQYLSASNTKLQGKLPSSIGNLKFLKELHLWNCSLSGTIPPSLANLTHLTKLYISSNSFKGQIPSSFKGSFPNLQELSLSNNLLQGPIDSYLFFLPSLHLLDLCNNHFSGFTNDLPFNVIVEDTNNLSYEGLPINRSGNHIVILDLSNNQLSGLIPTFLGSTNLGVLDLENNKLHGPIPDTFKNGCSLHSLKLNENMLQGEVPSSLCNCKELKVLDIGDNQLNGTFPYCLENLSELEVLVMRSNKFGGPIGQLSHVVDSPFPNVHVFDISFNAFVGNLPLQYILHWKAMMTVENNSNLNYLYFKDNSSSQYYQDTVAIVYKGLYLQMPGILTTLITIDLSNNNFKGKIPEALGNLKALKVLNLSGNSLTGQIPFSFGNLSELESLDLSKNQLSGEIPRQLTSLTFLSDLNVSYNNLIGSIPQGSQFNTFSNDSYEGNVGLCGLPLSRKCGITDRALPPASSSQKNDDSTSLLDWKFAIAGYCSGLVIGLVVGQQLFWRNDQYFRCI